MKKVIFPDGLILPFNTDAIALPASLPKYHVCNIDFTSDSQSVFTALPLIKITTIFLLCFEISLSNFGCP